MVDESRPCAGSAPPARPQVGDLPGDVRSAVQGASRREPDPLLAAVARTGAAQA